MSSWLGEWRRRRNDAWRRRRGSCDHGNTWHARRRGCPKIVLAVALVAACAPGGNHVVAVRGSAASTPAPTGDPLPNVDSLSDMRVTTTSAAHASPPRASRSKTTARPRVAVPPAAPRPAVVSTSVDGMPGLLRRIGGCESSGRPDGPLVWNAVNRSGSSASGAFQILDGTWRSWRKAYGADVGAGQYARAKDAPPSVQVHVATGAFNAQGSGPWKASRGCWA